MRLALLLAAASLLAAAPAAAQTIPDAFTGSWKGAGSQSDEAGEWTIAYTLADGRPGAVVGTITYPSLECGGDLILRNADREHVELGERITFGDCVDHGIVTLTPAARGIAFGWRTEAGGPTARGMLARAAQPKN
jgi:hypothetical protein